MNSLGRTIQCLRKAKGATQEQMARQIGVTFQAISKWENEYTLPDIMLLPVIADYFGISIDDLFQYKWNALTSKERLVSFMLKNGILRLRDGLTRDGKPLHYELNTERFTTNMQLNAIGDAFAECLLDQHVEFEVIAGLAYHGIGFAASTAVALQSRYGITTHFCYDRMVEDRKGRSICGYTPCDGDRMVVIDDVIGSGRSLNARIDRIREYADVHITAVLVIAETSADALARKQLEEKYHTRVYGLLNDEDIQSVLKRKIISF